MIKESGESQQFVNLFVDVFRLKRECVTFSILIKKGGVIISDDNNR